MGNYIIRSIRESEYHLLEDFLYEAIFQRDEENLLPKDIIKEPELNVFIKDFGKKNDYGLVAEVDGKIVGAVWTRILAGDTKGFGNIDDKTPEFAISVYKEHRGRGIGTALMKEMLKGLADRGYEKTSLAVQKDNYAVRMYQAVGFKIIEALEEEYLMVHWFKY